MKTLAYGFPKLGEKREFKSLLENFWKGKIDETQFVSPPTSYLTTTLSWTPR
jgi:hypothetical protein